MSQAIIDTLSQRNYLSSSDLWHNPLPAELTDVFAMSGRVSFIAGQGRTNGQVLVEIDRNSPLYMQNAKLRDAVFMATGVFHHTVAEIEKGPATRDVLLSEGSIIYVPDHKNPNEVKAALTQRSIRNPKTGEIISSPGTWQNPRGKMEDQRTYATEAGQEQLLLTEVQKSTGQIGLTALLVVFNGMATVSPEEKREQLNTYEAFLNQQQTANQAFSAAAVDVRLAPATLAGHRMKDCWDIVTMVDGIITRRIPGIPFARTQTNSFEFSVPLQLTDITTERMRIVAMEPGPAQPTAFMSDAECLAMPRGLTRPQKGEVIGGMNEALYAGLRGLFTSQQVETNWQQNRHSFDTSKMQLVA